MIRIPVSRYLLTNGLRPSRILVLRDIVFSKDREHLASEESSLVEHLWLDQGLRHPTPKD